MLRIRSEPQSLATVLLGGEIPGEGLMMSGGVGVPVEALERLRLHDGARPPGLE